LRGSHPPPKFVCGADKPPPPTGEIRCATIVSSYVVKSIETTQVGNMAVIYGIELYNHFLSNAFASTSRDFFLTGDLNAISAAFAFFFLSTS
jgi:hypothetical protein